MLPQWLKPVKKGLGWCAGAQQGSERALRGGQSLSPFPLNWKASSKQELGSSLGSLLTEYFSLLRSLTGEFA